MTTQAKKFREDINGLRAWAVVAVILFHFNVPGFSGGFVGVDIFFVISGYLMTGIITRGLNDNNFSFINFYLSRARRILPALLVLCAALLVVTWFSLAPPELKDHLRHTFSALSFSSNIRFSHETGYFDTASHEKLLLHTWSLAVEWQFYIILPLILGAIWKFSPTQKALLITLLVGFFISLSLSIFITPSSPSVAFYLLHTRAWEMLTGGLVYLLANQIILTNLKQRIIETIGFSLIIFSILIFDTQSSWPGWRALIPVVGSLLVLIAARQASMWTSNSITQRLGDWSYSLYLWHWPLAAGLYHINLSGDPKAILICLALTLFLGWISYRYIETPARTRLSTKSNWKNFANLGVALLIVVISASIVRHYRNDLSRMPVEVAAIFKEIENRNPRDKECSTGLINACQYGGDTLGIIAIGDSHSASLVRSIEKSLPSDNLHLLDWSVHGCPTIRNVHEIDDKYSACSKFIDLKLQENKEIDPLVPIIIISRVSMYFFGDNEIISSKQEKKRDYNLEKMQTGMIETACEFAKVRPVYMIRPIPELELNVPNVMGKALWQTGKPREVSISLEDYHKRQTLAWNMQDIAAKRCGIKILNPLPYLCKENKCKGDIDGIPIYFDDDHLNERGGQLLIPLLKTVFTSNNN